MATGKDLTGALCEAVERCAATGGSLTIVGAGSKSFLTRGVEALPADAGGQLLSVAEHHGIVDYRPEELVLTARAGTPLREVERVLAQAGQHLPFEPPQFHGGGTLGGAVAAGLSGPGRPWRGALRDALLGVELLNGRGEVLRFGGQVMKNVAGYDVSRLQAGAFGTLGLLLAVSVKVLPRPSVERTRVFELPPAEALVCCRAWARRPYPITATCYHRGQLRVRLSGAEAAVTQAAAQLGGDDDTSSGFWPALRDQRLEFFAEPGLWRTSVPPAAALPAEDCLVTWGGAERWWRPGDRQAARRQAAAQGGYARPYDGSFGVRTGAHLSGAESRLSERLRQAFDPHRVFNRNLTSTAEADLAD
ncbi:MAG: glycolate oxidase subunit GlcE [Gammaproteobacteria bacterium]|nr:glycolate oxidase subunit GlcE [Gammaproteobacteria bacterium]